MKIALVFACLAAVALSQCTWKDKPGNAYDLSSLVRRDSDFIGDGAGYRYYVNVCERSMFPICGDSGYFGCAFTAGIPPQLAAGLGSFSPATNQPVWSLLDPADATKGVRHTYTNGQACGSTQRTTIFNFKCGENLDPTTVTVTNNDATCTTTIEHVSKAACPTAIAPPKKGGLSGGSVFLIIFFVTGFVYVAGGCFYKHKQKGTRGMESCPNVDFWRAIPGYTKEGFKFTYHKIRGCTGGGGASPTYEEI